jgi:hypothetical protein
MIDLIKLNNKIDKLFETETSDSLTKWLLNKRLGNINMLLGDGKFVNMRELSAPLFSNKNKGNFNQIDNNIPTNIPDNKLAA